MDQSAEMELRIRRQKDAHMLRRNHGDVERGIDANSLCRGQWAKLGQESWMFRGRRSAKGQEKLEKAMAACADLQPQQSDTANMENINYTKIVAMNSRGWFSDNLFCHL